MKTHEVLRYPPVAMQAGWASHFPGDDYKLFLEIELDAIKRGVIIFLLYHLHPGLKGHYISTLFPTGVTVVSANKSHIKLKHLKIKNKFFRN